MPRLRAVLFDFGGTLYDYSTFLPGGKESLRALAGWCGLDADVETLQEAYRSSLHRTFSRYLPRPFYHHQELFADTVREAFLGLGVEITERDVERYRVLQWQLQARDFQLREGVIATLQTLGSQGLHLGMVSNIDEDHLQHLVLLGKLEAHFHSLLSSETARSCKPDGRIFQQALEQAGCEPDEALFVGDSLSQDVEGANRAGLRSILLWHRRDRDPPVGEPGKPKPRHIIGSIPEVLSLLTP